MLSTCGKLSSPHDAGRLTAKKRSDEHWEPHQNVRHGSELVTHIESDVQRNPIRLGRKEEGLHGQSFNEKQMLRHSGSVGLGHWYCTLKSFQGAALCIHFHDQRPARQTDFEAA